MAEMAESDKSPGQKLLVWMQQHSMKLAVAGVAALAGVLFDRFSDEINAWVRSIFLTGVGGVYVLKTFTYPPGSSNLVDDTATVELKDGGGTVFGVIKPSDGTDYKLFGYHRVKYLAMSYGGRGPLGGGTLALQSEIASNQSPVFWGWANSIECVGPESFFVRCPALMYKQGSTDPTPIYSKFFQKDQCEKATSDKPAELCTDLKAHH
jgi:hypothetical protein